tara:strand:+ start:1520 stop:2182 length:663 start_codon:yes stop_codon:yes gene_type:complete
MRITESKLRRIIRQVIQETDISRRGFLQGLGKGAAAVAGVTAAQALGGGLESPIIDKISKYIDYKIRKSSHGISGKDVKQIKTPLGMYLASIMPGSYSLVLGFNRLPRLIDDLNESLERSGIDTSKLRLDDRTAHLILPDGRSIPRDNFDTVRDTYSAEQALKNTKAKFYFIETDFDRQSALSGNPHPNTGYFSEDPDFIQRCNSIINPIDYDAIDKKFN